MSNTHYIFLESLQNTYQAGGVVMLPILLAGVIGFYFLFSSWFRIGSDFFRADIHRVIKRMRLDLNGGNPACNQGGVLVLERKCYAVDCRNGTINECVNGTLQAKEQGQNLNSNNVVLELHLQ